MISLLKGGTKELMINKNYKIGEKKETKRIQKHKKELAKFEPQKSDFWITTKNTTVP